MQVNRFPADNPNLTYIGRWADLAVDGAKVKLAIASGGSLRFQFTGSSVKLDFLPFTVDPLVPEISYAIDDQPPVRIPLTEELAIIGVGGPEPHTLVVWVEGVAFPLRVQRWTCRQGVGLRGVELAPNGQLSAYPTGHAKKILVLGDSIGEGLLMLGGTAAENYPRYANGRLNFGNQLGARLRADVWFQCFGGAAIGQNFFDVPPLPDNYPFILEGCEQRDPLFDVVIIEGGHNDGGVPAERFLANYKALIGKVRQANPRAVMFLFPPLKPYAPEKFELVRALAGEMNCVFIDNHDWTVALPNENHPGVTGHARIAAYLEPLIQPYLK
jgi:lysophospholipase L1-like esterase